MNDKEFELIKYHADQCHLTASEYIRQLGLTITPKALPSEEIFSILNAIKDIELKLRWSTNPKEIQLSQLLQKLSSELRAIAYPAEG